MDAVFSSPLFGIVLCIFTFEIGVWLNRKTHSPLANPLLIAVVLCIAFLQIFSIPLADFNEGGRMISMFWRLPPLRWRCPSTVRLTCSKRTFCRLPQERWSVP